MTTAPTLDVLLTGDCLEHLAGQPCGVADLVYLDPPFNTGRVMASHAGAYDDRFADVTAYLAFLRPRVAAAIETLTPDGALMLHCDWRTAHHTRIMLDDLMGEDRFVNHLVWQYGLGGSSPRRFARKHDDILFYARSSDYWFEPPTVPSTSRRMAGRPKKATDVIDIPSINNMARERTGWPTQKPLALLRMLVGACCPPGGVVIDPFCGSGTTLVAAQSLDRHWVGIDRSADAIAIARDRLTNDVPVSAGPSRHSPPPRP